MGKRLTLAYPGDLDTLTGGYLYDKRMVSELRALGWSIQTRSLDAGFPNVSDRVCHSTAIELAKIDDGQGLVIDGLALGALGKYAAIISAQRPFTALVHHPLALESGIDTDRAAQLHQSELDALSQSSCVIVTSDVTRQTLIDQFEVPDHRISVVLPGVDKPEPIPVTHSTFATDKTQPVKLLSVGALVPRKGFDILINALGALGHLHWKLIIVGDTQRSPETTTELQTLIQTLGITERVTITGALPADKLASHYRDADLFVLASRYEGYGMAYAEALAWGLPVIGTNAGAAAQTLATDAAQVVLVDDVSSLRAALSALISQPERRYIMKCVAVQHALTLPTWRSSAEKFAAALTQTHIR